MERSGLIFENFCLEVVKNLQKKIFFGCFFASQKKISKGGPKKYFFGRGPLFFLFFGGQHYKKKIRGDVRTDMAAL